MATICSGEVKEIMNSIELAIVNNPLSERNGRHTRVRKHNMIFSKCYLS